MDHKIDTAMKEQNMPERANERVKTLQDWKNVKIVSDENLKSMSSNSYSRDKRDGINKSVKGDLMKMFK